MRDYQVVWTQNAQRGVAEEAAYIQGHTSRSPHAWLVRLLERIEQLASMPGIGPPWGPGRHLGIRQLTVDGYVVLYTVDEEAQTVYIASVRSGRRSPPSPEEVDP